MFKIKIVISIFIFSTLLVITSLIKNQTRIIEKNIDQIDKRITYLKKDLYRIQALEIYEKEFQIILFPSFIQGIFYSYYYYYSNFYSNLYSYI